MKWFRLPTALEFNADKLKEAERELASHKAAFEYHQHMSALYEARIRRLKHEQVIKSTTGNSIDGIPILSDNLPFWTAIRSGAASATPANKAWDKRVGLQDEQGDY